MATEPPARIVRLRTVARGEICCRPGAHWLGPLRRPNGDRIAINGLWGLLFGNGVPVAPTTLLFNAAINDEADRLLGRTRHVG